MSARHTALIWGYKILEKAFFSGDGEAMQTLHQALMWVEWISRSEREE
jgi:hypothetical protein